MPWITYFKHIIKQIKAICLNIEMLKIVRCLGNIFILFGECITI